MLEKLDIIAGHYDSGFAVISFVEEVGGIV